MQWQVMAAAVLSLAVLGCGSGSPQVKTHIVEMPRVDLQVEGAGNRGYLFGTPPMAGALKTTRQVVETTVLLPGLSDANGLPAAGGGGYSAVASTVVVAPQQGNYVVKEGDTLWSIAADPAVYGDASYWKDLLDANRDQLQNADALRAGMQLNVPTLQKRATAVSDKGGAVVK